MTLTRRMTLLLLMALALHACASSQEPDGMHEPAQPDYLYGGHHRKDLATDVEIENARLLLQENLNDRFPDAMIRQCEDVVQLTVGVVGGNVIYAANCMVEDSGVLTSATICADTMVGYFSTNHGTRVTSADESADFAYTNCTGG